MKVRYNTTPWPEATPSNAWECFICTQGRAVKHTGRPVYAAQSLPSGFWLYACEVMNTMETEMAMRLGDAWLDQQIAGRRGRKVGE